MFDLGWSEMLVVGIVALLVIGPKDLPAALRQVGKWMGTVRRMASDFQGQVNQAMREAELDELRREVSNLKTGLNTVTDPVRSAGHEVKALVESPAALPPPDPKSAEPAAASTVSKTSPAAPKADKPAPVPKPKPKRAPRKKPEPRP